MFQSSAPPSPCLWLPSKIASLFRRQSKYLPVTRDGPPSPDLLWSHHVTAPGSSHLPASLGWALPLSSPSQSCPRCPPSDPGRQEGASSPSFLLFRAKPTAYGSSQPGVELELSCQSMLQPQQHQIREASCSSRQCWAH